MEAFLLGNLKMYVSDDHRFGTDAFLLAYFSHVKQGSIVCDLCTGCGIIPLLLYKNTSPRLIYAVDIQKEAIELLQKSVKTNNLENIVAPICEDLKNLTQVPEGSVDVVTANPPYLIAGAGLERSSRPQAIARHELLCNMDDIAKTASKLLKFGGYLKVCQRPDRLSDVIYSMRKYGIEPKNMTLVHNNANEKPWLVLISGKKGGKPGIQIDKPMMLRKDDKQYTEEFKSIYE